MVLKNFKELYYEVNKDVLTPEEIEKDKKREQERNQENRYVSYFPKRDMRAITKKAEAELTKYLNDTLFKHMKEKGIVADVITDVTPAMDISGIDALLITNKGNKIKVDHKAQLMYLNRPRNTWSMELRYNDRAGNRIDGWFLQCQPGHPSGHQTDYLALTYIDKTKANSIEEFTADKIDRLTVLYVKVSEIAKYLADRGKTPDVLKADAENASAIYNQRKNELLKDEVLNLKEYEDARRIKEDVFLNKSGHHDAYYYVSDGKKDINSSPVNIIIRKEVLERLPHSLEFIVEPDRVVHKKFDPQEKINVKTLKEAARNNSSFKTDYNEQERARA